MGLMLPLWTIKTYLLSTCFLLYQPVSDGNRLPQAHSKQRLSSPFHNCLFAGRCLCLPLSWSLIPMMCLLPSTSRYSFCTLTNTSLFFLNSNFLSLLGYFKKIFIWLHHVIWDLVPWPGFEPRFPCLGAQSPTIRPPGKSPNTSSELHTTLGRLPLYCSHRPASLAYFPGTSAPQALCYPASIANAPIFCYRVKPSCSCSTLVRFLKRVLLLSHTHGSSDLSTILVSEGRYCVTVFLFGPTNNSGQIPLKGRNGILISSPGQWCGGLNRILKIDLQSVIFDKLLNTLNLLMGEGVAPLSLCYLATYMALDFQDI